MVAYQTNLKFEDSETIELQPFQKCFIRNAFRHDIQTAVLSIARGNGKSTLAAWILTKALTPGDPYFVGGHREALLIAASIKQARYCFAPVREALEPTGEYTFRDSSNELAITHKATKAKLTVLSSKANTAMGIVRCPLLVADEPGSWEVTGGALLNSTIDTSLGKPDSELRVVWIGTLWPGAPGGWWQQMVKTGSAPGRYVQSVVGDAEKWDKASEIKRCNPLMWKYPKSRQKLLQQRDDARDDSRLKSQFLSLRLNIPTGDESTMLLTADDWERTLSRDIQEREGTPVIGADLGSGRAWSAAVAVWPNGRVEAFALAPGIPSIADQEKADQVPPGTYQKLVDSGYLQVQDGKRVQEVGLFAELIENKWPDAKLVICDRHRINEFKDHLAVKVEDRRTRWFEAAEDIRALRKWAKDGPLNVDKGSRKLISASLLVAMVQGDDQGNTRLVKRGFNNQARDDVAAALVLAVGKLSRKKKTGFSVYVPGGRYLTAG